MRRITFIALAVSVALVAIFALAGCSDDKTPAAALKKGNAALASYAKSEEAVAARLAEAAAVQPSPEGVKPGLAALAEVNKMMVQRRAYAAAAKQAFAEYQDVAKDAKQKEYAALAIALAEGLIKLDTGTTSLAKNMTALYQAVAQNSSDTAKVSALADAVTKGQTQYEQLRAQVKTLSDAADQFYQQNLANQK
jgi:hypothetical protein